MRAFEDIRAFIVPAALPYEDEEITITQGHIGPKHLRVGRHASEQACELAAQSFDTCD